MNFCLLTLILMVITHRIDGKLAIVTGGNRGIGFETALGICQRFNGDVIITSRSSEEGEKAVEELKSKGCSNVASRVLDITSKKSVTRFRNDIKENFQGIDILVNNAGVAHTFDKTMSLYEKAEKEMAVNYFGTKRVLEMLVPLLNDGARVVDVSSAAGELVGLGDSPASLSLRKMLATSGDSMTIKKLDEIMLGYLSAVKDGSYIRKGWNDYSYGASKIGESALTRILAQEIGKYGNDIVINYNHPGFTLTDMTIPFMDEVGMPRYTPEEGAMSSIKLAFLPPGTKYNGMYFDHDCSIRDWVTHETIEEGNCTVMA